MRYEKIGEDHHIYVEKGETERQVLRVLVKASFELARPVGLGWFHFKDETKDEIQMADEIADQFIDLPPRLVDTVINMDYVQGRQCKTFIRKVAEGHFQLANHSYERDRGIPEPFFERAKEILTGKTVEELISTSYMYRGESLTLRLQEYGFERQPGENDWDFRKRIFPDLFPEDGDRAMEFLMGGSAAEWDERDKMFYFVFVRQNQGKPSRQELIMFAKGFAVDPFEMRGRRQAAPTN